MSKYGNNSIVKQLLDEMYSVNKAHRDTKEAVLATHENVTPFISCAEVETAFTDYMNSL